LFLIEAISQWHHQGLKVSLTLHPRQGRMIPPNVYKLLDRIHFMTYDMIAPDRKYHASLPKVRQAVEELLQPGGGVETMPHKVLLGIPAYARHLANPSQVKTFGEIYDEIHNEFTPNDNPTEETKQFLLGDMKSTLNSWNGYEWESSSRIRAKIDLAKELNLGGVFFWELGQDKLTEGHPSGVLLETAIAANYERSSSSIGASEL
jgi:GH18 family chitinase